MTEARDPSGPQGPPEPPEVTRRLRLYTLQWVGIPLLLLVPVLALLNVFGPAFRHAEVSDGEIAMRVTYPVRDRTGRRTELLVEVRNSTASRIDTLSLVIDTAYANSFVHIRITPAVRVAYVVQWFGVGPGEVRVARMEIEGERPWGREGYIAATAGRADTLTYRFRTFLFP